MADGEVVVRNFYMGKSTAKAEELNNGTPASYVRKVLKYLLRFTQRRSVVQF